MEIETIKMNSGKEAFVNEYNFSIKVNYDIISELGKGGYGKVLEVRHKKTNAIRACKYISKLKIKEKDLQRIRREINILKKADHPNIVKVYEIYETKRSLYIIMEKCNGGELFDRIIDNISKNKMYSEKVIAKIMLQIMSAINYCHKNGICHRDLKPENILFSNKDNEENNPIKLIDFGLSQIIDEKKLKSKVGTAYYVSPEVLSGKYTEKCDVWGAGIILCILLTGEPPFNGQNSGVIYNKIRNYEYSFTENWRFISNEAKDLVSHMLVPEKYRYDSTQVLAHPWFKKNCENIQSNFYLDINSLKNYSKMSTFKKIILTFIASRLDENNNDIRIINNYFKLFDRDNDGQISYEEFQSILMNMNIESNEIKNLFNSLDVSKNGIINYNEFIAAFMQKNIYLKKELIYEAFTLFDKNNKRIITKEDIMNALNLNTNEIKEIEQITSAFFEKKREGYIDINSFEELINEL